MNRDGRGEGRRERQRVRESAEKKDEYLKVVTTEALKGRQYNKNKQQQGRFNSLNLPLITILHLPYHPS